MQKVTVKDTDILIIGGGIAGTLAAIEAKKKKVKNVTIVEKNKVGRSGCSAFAAGILRVYFPEDDFDAWLREEVGLLQYTTNQKWLQICMERMYDIVNEMDTWGVKFKKRDGKFERVMGRGSSPEGVIRKIMFYGGPQLMETLRKKCVEMQVQIIDRVMITSLLTKDGRGAGAIGFDTRSGEVIAFKAKATILAAGGNRWKSVFMGHKFSAGDMHSAFYRAGGEVSRCEYTNYNTTCSEFDLAGLNMFVGMGGKFVNKDGDTFMTTYSPKYKDRAEMDILSSAMAMEVRQGRGPIYLDITHFTPNDIAYIRDVLPLVTKILERTGVLVGDKIMREMPWIADGPENESQGAGITIDMECQTSIGGFFAAGGTATKDYFAIPWAAVSGAKAGQSAADYIGEVQDISIDSDTIEASRKFGIEPLERKGGISPDHILLSVQEAILPYDVYLIRHKDRLIKALEEIEQIRDTQLPFIYAYDPHYLRMAHEAQNLVLCSEMLLRSALVREESRHGHLREDYPETDNINWLKWTALKKEANKMVVSTKDIPIDDYPVKPERKKFKHPVFAAADRLSRKMEG